MGTTLLMAFALMLVIEGLFPDAEFDPGGGVLRVGASLQDA